jgi:outer membrane protein assembly factor BamB
MANGTVVALNATDGKLIWQSSVIGNPELGYSFWSGNIRALSCFGYKVK